MSERGSFVTEYIYCKMCFQNLWKVLDSHTKYLSTTRIPHWDIQQQWLPIIAGKVGGLYAGEELNFFGLELRPEIEAAICHPVRIAVLPDCPEDEIIYYLPSGAPRNEG